MKISLVLQAHLQKNPQDGDYWRALGQVHQELDQDQKSVSCFLKSADLNPLDSESYLQLGVSCSNILDEVHAIHYLEMWL